MMRWLLVVAMVGVLVACGSGDDDSPAPATTTSPGTAATESVSGSNGSDTNSNVSNIAQNDASGATITINGDIEASVAVAGSCGTGVVGDDLQYNASGMTETNDAYMLQIYINDYNGPGEYAVAEPGSSYDASITYSDGVGGSWITNSDLGGTVIVNSDGTSGTVDATLQNHENTDQQATVSGDWVCDPD